MPSLPLLLLVVVVALPLLPLFSCPSDMVIARVRRRRILARKAFRIAAVTAVTVRPTASRLTLACKANLSISSALRASP